MQCPICNSELINLHNDLYLCEGSNGLHVFTLNMPINEEKTACSFICLYPRKYEDNLYAITGLSDNQGIYSLAK